MQCILFVIKFAIKNFVFLTLAIARTARMERVGEGRGRRAAVTKTRRMHPRGTSM
jgi:hypothetical protein